MDNYAIGYADYWNITNSPFDNEAEYWRGYLAAEKENHLLIFGR